MLIIKLSQQIIPKFTSWKRYLENSLYNPNLCLPFENDENISKLVTTILPHDTKDYLTLKYPI
jgi:hypothetical protein